MDHGKPTSDASAFVRLHTLWREGDMDGFFALISDDIEWYTNIDGLTAPYAGSSVGKEDLRFRFGLLRQIFHVRGFINLHLEQDGSVGRSVNQLDYVHRVTGEPINVVIRFTGWCEAGLLVRMEETVDAAYVTAYDNFVQSLMDAAEGSGPG